MSQEQNGPGDIEPGSTTPQDVADELVAHGVLEHLVKDDAAAKHRRLAVLRARLTGAAEPIARSAARRTRVLALAAAAAVVIVATVFWLVQPDGPPAEMLAQLEQPTEEAIRFTFTARTPSGAVFGEWDRGRGAERVLVLHVKDPRKSRKLVRNGDGATHYFDGVSPQRSPTWIEWVQVGATVIPLRSPREWLTRLLRTHDLRWEGSARIVGKRRGEDPLEPERFELVFDPGRKVIERLRLGWSTPRTRGRGQAIRFLTAPPEFGADAQPPYDVAFRRSGPQTHPEWWFTARNR